MGYKVGGERKLPVFNDPFLFSIVYLVGSRSLCLYVVLVVGVGRV